MVGLFLSPKHCGSWGMFTMCQWEYGSFSNKLNKSLPYNNNPRGGGLSIKSDGGVRMLDLREDSQIDFFT